MGKADEVREPRVDTHRTTPGTAKDAQVPSNKKGLYTEYKWQHRRSLPKDFPN